MTELRVFDGIRLFAQYGRTLEGFYMGDGNRAKLDIREDERYFHELDRVGGGLRWISKYLDVSLGAGWAFNHRYLTGWDLRNLDRYRELEGGWYVFLRLQGAFGINL